MQQRPPLGFKQKPKAPPGSFLHLNLSFCIISLFSAISLLAFLRLRLRMRRVVIISSQQGY